MSIGVGARDIFLICFVPGQGLSGQRRTYRRVIETIVVRKKKKMSGRKYTILRNRYVSGACYIRARDVLLRIEIIVGYRESRVCGSRVATSLPPPDTACPKIKPNLKTKGEREREK